MDDDQVNERSIEQSESDIIYEEVQASLLPEYDTDSEEEPNAHTETEPYALSLINLQTLHRYEYIMILYAQRFGLQTLLFLQLLWTLFSRASTTTQKVSMGVLRSIQTQMYVFFQGSYYPYRAQTTMLAGPGIAPVEWYYNADTKVFISSTVYNSTNEYQTYHLEWLAAEVKYNDLVLYDCLLYTSPSPRDRQKSRMPSSA